MGRVCPSPTGAAIYLVRPGDTLTSIVRRRVLAPGASPRTVARAVTLVARRNFRVVPNANLIRAGQRLVLPCGASAAPPPAILLPPVTG
jgi:hypothetical protein